MPRRATRHNKRDANEASVVAALKKIGVEWLEAPPLDGWIFLQHLGWVPCEIKTKTGTLTPGQARFIEKCEIYERPHAVWRSAEEAIKFVQVVREMSNDRIYP